MEGEFKAWLLIDDGTNIADRFTESTFFYELVDGTPIADNFADLIDGDGITNPINRDAAGGLVGATAVWTNVRADDGNPITFRDCADWSSSDGGIRGQKGDNFASDAFWTQNLALFCNNSLPLYCFQQ